MTSSKYLTKRRLNLLIEAKKAFTYFNAWSQNGNILWYYNEEIQVVDDFKIVCYF